MLVNKNYTYIKKYFNLLGKVLFVVKYGHADGLTLIIGLIFIYQESSFYYMVGFGLFSTFEWRIKLIAFVVLIFRLSQKIIFYLVYKY